MVSRVLRLGDSVVLSVGAGGYDAGVVEEVGAGVGAGAGDVGIGAGSEFEVGAEGRRTGSWQGRRTVGRSGFLLRSGRRPGRDAGRLRPVWLRPGCSTTAGCWSRMAAAIAALPDRPPYPAPWHRAAPGTRWSGRRRGPG